MDEIYVSPGTLIALFDKYGEQSKVAEALGVSGAYVSKKRKKYGLQIWKVLRPMATIPEKEKSHDIEVSG